MSVTEKGDRKYLINIYMGMDGKTRKTKSKRVNLQHLTPTQAAKEIIILERAFEDEVKGFPNLDKSMTFQKFYELWRSDYAVFNLRPKTLASYDYEIKARILPFFGFRKITEIAPMLLNQFYAGVAASTYTRGKGKKKIPLSTRTIRYQHQILSSMFGKAFHWQLINDNPCKYVTPPKQKSEPEKQKKYWEISEALVFFGLLDGIALKYQGAFLLAMIGGLRTEEILGLDEDDLTDDGVFIRRTSKIVAGKMLVEEEAKNNSSIRFVSLPNFVVAKLKQQRSAQRARKLSMQAAWLDRKENDEPRILLFTQSNGLPMYGTTLNNKLKSLIKEYNATHAEKLSLISFHGLRHSNAAIMVYLGGDIKIGAGRLGHAQTSTYVNMYGGKLEKADKEISDKIGELLVPKKNAN